jgi:predicted DNA-binding antitoxin AbrB/MazE fold protein
MPIEAIYEQGTLKLSQPITLAEGSKVQIIILSSESSAPEKTPLKILQEIAQLPLEGKTDAFSGQDHDQVLYS